MKQQNQNTYNSPPVGVISTSQLMDSKVQTSEMGVLFFWWVIDTPSTSTCIIELVFLANNSMVFNLTTLYRLGDFGESLYTHFSSDGLKKQTKGDGLLTENSSKYLEVKVDGTDAKRYVSKRSI